MKRGRHKDFPNRISKFAVIILLFICINTKLHASLLERVEKSLRENDIEMALKSAIRLKENQEGSPVSKYILGKVYFYQGRYEEAVNLVRDACIGEPDKQKWRDFLMFAEKTNEITKEFQSYKTEHFNILISKRDSVLAYYIKDHIETIYDRISKELKYFPEGQIRIEIYPGPEEFGLASGLSSEDMEVSGAIGVCKFNKIMILSPRCLMFGYRWVDALTHEYTHFLIINITNNNCPIWLNEGLAKYFESIWRTNNSVYLTPVYKNILAKVAQHNQYLNFSKMEKSMPKLGSREEVALAFAEASNAVEMIFKKYGRNRLIRLLRQLGKGRGFDATFKKIFGKDQVEIEREWRNYLKNKGYPITEGAVVDSSRLEGKGRKYNELEEYVRAEARSYIRLGDMFRRRGRHEIALEEYGKALKIDPQNPVVLVRMSYSYFAKSEFKKGEEALIETIELNPNYPTSYINLADYYFRNKELKKALSLYKESNQINPFNPHIHKRMGIIFYYMDDIEHALKEWEITIQLDPEELEVKSWIMLWRERQIIPLRISN